MLEKINLPNVTLTCVDSLYIDQSKKAIDICCSYCNFGEILFITDKIENGPSGKFNYCRFLINELYKYIKSDYILICQWDGYIRNPRAWTNEFLDYDYIGAPWDFNDPESVGNGGFSLRSKKLMTAMAELSLTAEECWPEDRVICRKYRKYLNDLGFKFAPIDLAKDFSVEVWNGGKYTKQFGFHNFKTHGLNQKSINRNLLKSTSRVLK